MKMSLNSKVIKMLSGMLNESAMKTKKKKKNEK